MTVFRANGHDVAASHADGGWRTPSGELIVEGLFYAMESYESAHNRNRLRIVTKGFATREEAEAAAAALSGTEVRP